MEAGIIIGIIAAITGILGLAYTMYRNHQQTMQKINENALRIAEFEKELVEIKQNSTRKYEGYVRKLEEFRKENNNEHQTIIVELRDFLKELTAVTAEFKAYKEYKK